MLSLGVTARYALRAHGRLPRCRSVVLAAAACVVSLSRRGKFVRWSRAAASFPGDFTEPVGIGPGGGARFSLFGAKPSLQECTWLQELPEAVLPQATTERSLRSLQPPGLLSTSWRGPPGPRRGCE